MQTQVSGSGGGPGGGGGEGSAFDTQMRPLLAVLLAADGPMTERELWQVLRGHDAGLARGHVGQLGEVAHEDLGRVRHPRLLQLLPARVALAHALVVEAVDVVRQRHAEPRAVDVDEAPGPVRRRVAVVGGGGARVPGQYWARARIQPGSRAHWAQFGPFGPGPGSGPGPGDFQKIKLPVD